MPRLNLSTLPPLQFWALMVVLMALFLMGGSARSDVQSLAILTPATVIFCGLAFPSFKYEHWNDNKSLLIGFAVFFLIVVFYVVPLPVLPESFSLATESLRAIRAVANTTDASPILSVMPAAAWQSFFFLFAPLAVFLLAIQIKRDDLMLTLPIMIFVGIVSGVIGVLQLAGNSDSPIYLYRISNNGSAVGLFANRNHAAVFLACLFPILSVFATKLRGTRSGERNISQLVAISVAILLVPLILVTGSRAGVLAGVIGMVGGVVLYGTQISTNGRQTNRKFLTPILAASILLSLVFATIYFSRAEAINRFFVDPSTGSSRAEFWTSSLNLFWNYFPFGFGPGSFVPAFLNEEPRSLLSHVYLNRLHNDWLETAITFGVPGILLMLGAVAFYVRRSFILWFRMDGTRSAVALGRMASVIFAILGIASMSDYPLRTPAMMGFAALALIWLKEAGAACKLTPDNPG